jgi:hypothetical protein
MSKGGLRKNSEGSYNHLFSSKWKLGKTTTIRIPEILKDKILELARYLDKNQKEEIEEINLVSIFDSNKQLNKNQIYKAGIECLEEFFTEKGFSLEELQASRAGTKKRQMAEIHKWLVKKSNE